MAQKIPTTSTSGGLILTQEHINALLTAAAFLFPLLSPEIRVSLDAERDAGKGRPADDSLDLDFRLAATEREIVSRALAVASGNQSLAARLLGISRNGLAAKIARHGLAPAGESEADDERS